MPAQFGKHTPQQCGQIVSPSQQVGNPPSLAQPVAQLAKIARAASARHDSAQSAPDIGQTTQQGPQVLARKAIVVQPGDTGEPLLDGGNIAQGRGQIIGQLARARAGHAAIDAGDHAARA